MEKKKEVSILHGMCNRILSYSTPINSDERKLHSGPEKAKKTLKPKPKQKTPTQLRKPLKNDNLSSKYTHMTTEPHF